jgi:hypothetical protein
MLNTQNTFTLLLVSILMLQSSPLSAQINSYSIANTITQTSGPYTIDVNNDGNDDYSFEILPLSGSNTAARVICLGNSGVMDNSTFGYPDALNFSDSVTGPFSIGTNVLGTDVGGAGAFAGTGIHYLGIRVDASGQNHYGWISLEVSATNDTISLYEVGYQTVSSIGILAGGTDAVSLDETAEDALLIYPNPCNDVLYIVGTGSAASLKPRVYNISGMEMAIGSSGNVLNVSNLDSGTYILEAFDGNRFQRYHVVKK